MSNKVKSLHEIPIFEKIADNPNLSVGVTDQKVTNTWCQDYHICG